MGPPNFPAAKIKIIIFDFYKLMSSITIKKFYQEILGDSCPVISQFLAENIHNDIGHFNVFNIPKIYRAFKLKTKMPCNRQTYYKISLIDGKNNVEYDGKTIDIEDCAILFASPKPITVTRIFAPSKLGIFVFLQKIFYQLLRLG